MKKVVQPSLSELDKMDQAWPAVIIVWLEKKAPQGPLQSHCAWAQAALTVKVTNTKPYFNEYFLDAYSVPRIRDEDGKKQEVSSRIYD